MSGFTVLIPAYNEEEIIRESVGKVRDCVKGMGRHEILVVENGSTDNTLRVARELGRRFGDVRSVSLPKPNLGEALIAGIRAARFEKIVFIPMDLSMNMEFIGQALGLLDNYDMVIGSRRVKGSRVDRSRFRELTGSGFQGLTRVMMNTKVRDTTFVKAFSRPEVMKLIPKLRFHYLFDTELVLRAEKEKLKMIEIPVKQVDERKPRERMGRKVARKFGYISALRIFMWLERPLITLGTLGVIFLIIGIVSGAYVVVMKYLFALKIANTLGMAMLSVLFIISGLLLVVLAFLTQILMTINSRLEKIEEGLEKRD